MKPSQCFPQSYRGVPLATTQYGLPVAILGDTVLHLSPDFWTGLSEPTLPNLQPFRQRLTPAMKALIDGKLARQTISE